MTPDHAPSSAGSSGLAPHLPAPPLALALTISQNLVNQVIMIALVAVAALPLAPWTVVGGWCLVVAAIAWGEDVLNQRNLTEGAGRLSRIGAPALGMLSAVLYALAAVVLMGKGDAAGRTFGFTLMMVSMVHILMRHYHSPVIFLVSIAPHVAVIGLIGFAQARMALAQDKLLAAYTPIATAALFAALFWTARGQLSRSWNALIQAKSDALERERLADEANKAKSNFLATMSHEIRTPLNGVLGMAQAMTVDELTNVQRERLKVIRRAGESLLAVLNDLLDLSKIEANKIELENGEFDMAHLARGVVAAFTPLANKKGVAFGFDIDDSALGVYRGDSTRVRQVLYNLVSNAVKFTGAGQVKLSIHRAGGQLVFEVEDSGIGLSEEGLSHLFENFYQADASNSRKFGGTGLGLSISRELVGLMGGSIEAASTLGVGSRFTVSLPLKRISSKPAAPRAEPERPSVDAEASEIRILAAEDNEVNQLVLKTLLLQAGIQSTIVSDGRQAVEAWEEGEWDVILMDVQMPEMDGIAATRMIRLREDETGRRRTPIIAVTANAMAHQLVEYQAAGMDGLVSKPIEIKNLFMALEQALAAADDDMASEAAA